MAECPVCGDDGYDASTYDPEGGEEPEGWCEACGFLWQFPQEEQEAAADYLSDVITPEGIAELEARLAVWKRVQVQKEAKHGNEKPPQGPPHRA